MHDRACVELHTTLDLIQSHFRYDEPLFTLKHEEYSMDINFFFVYNQLKSALLHGHCRPFLLIRAGFGQNFRSRPQKLVIRKTAVPCWTNSKPVNYGKSSGVFPAALGARSRETLPSHANTSTYIQYALDVLLYRYCTVQYVPYIVVRYRATMLNTTNSNMPNRLHDV